MGDRTTVTLTVLACHTEAVQAITDDANQVLDDDTARFTYFIFEEVNYGNLDFLDQLQAAGIAYDSAWEAGGEYREGTDHLRFTVDGEVILKEIYTADRNPSIDLLAPLLDDAPALQEYLRTHIERISLLPWDNQVECGKLFRARQLIQPKG